MIFRCQLFVMTLNGNGKNSLKLDFLRSNPTWSLLEEQNDIESLIIKGWTHFIYHLKTEQIILNKAKNIEINKEDHFYNNQKVNMELLQTLPW